MIKLMPASADLFDSKANFLVCPVNTRGIMGAGLAKEFKHRFPEESQDYIRMRLRRPGTIMVSGRVIFAATKDDWRDPSKIEYVDSVCRLIAIRADKSAAVPALGAGLGWLPWKFVYSVMQKYFTASDCLFEVYPPK